MRALISLITWFLCAVQNAQCDTEESPQRPFAQGKERKVMHKLFVSDTNSYWGKLFGLVSSAIACFS